MLTGEDLTRKWDMSPIKGIPHLSESLTRRERKFKEENYRGGEAWRCVSCFDGGEVKQAVYTPWVEWRRRSASPQS